MRVLVFRRRQAPPALLGARHACSHSYSAVCSSSRCTESSALTCSLKLSAAAAAAGAAPTAAASLPAVAPASLLAAMLLRGRVGSAGAALGSLGAQVQGERGAGSAGGWGLPDRPSPQAGELK